MKLKEKYYKYLLQKFEVSLAEKILFDIKRDFTDRKGLRHSWEDIDEDIQEEILEKWLNIIKTRIDEK